MNSVISAYAFYSLPGMRPVCPKSIIENRGWLDPMMNPTVIYGDYQLHEYIKNPTIAFLLGRKELEVRRLRIVVDNPLELHIQPQATIKYEVSIPGFKPF